MANENVEKSIPLKGAQVFVKTALSQKGFPYSYFEIVVNGKSVRAGFVGASEELALLRAGIDVQ